MSESIAPSEPSPAPRPGAALSASCWPTSCGDWPTGLEPPSPACSPTGCSTTSDRHHHLRHHLEKRLEPLGPTEGSAGRGCRVGAQRASLRLDCVAAATDFLTLCQCWVVTSSEADN